MNERIFKLALKAMDFQGAVDTDTELKLTNSELEKFAELIVAECKENFAKVWYEQGMDIRGADIIKFLDRFDEYVGVEE